jgi:hypothetical protein
VLRREAANAAKLPLNADGAALFKKKNEGSVDRTCSRSSPLQMAGF